ncbi:hypothetical protein FE840_015205 [Peteryoungia desertarenae]|uniref:Uncharacterized protein n=1 Tax=Peteryoungia desertarenae TaxID=1813451 RepID=A0ABX6QQ91_9HYPH|nr:hypothetical protein [Peteryoungia desertarenae]QLF70778.1 hypothetical protein FE840_015205 [Peteryoungia desertarenae]
MKTIAIPSAFLLLVATATLAMAIEPIPGSITYGGKSPRVDLAPAGSNFFHNFYANGSEVQEIYRINPDHSVSLVSRTVANR